jgi:hypothetical protein
LVPKGQKTPSGTVTAVELLPSPDFANQLLTQVDKCHAMAVEVLAEDPYKATENSEDIESYGKWWQRYYNLQWEISIAERQVEILKLDARILFDEANHYLISEKSTDKMRYLNAFQSSCATYMDRLEQISMYLEQAREAGWKVRCHILTASVNN